LIRNPGLKTPIEPWILNQVQDDESDRSGLAERSTVGRRGGFVFVVEVGALLMPVAVFDAAESVQRRMHRDRGERKVASAMAPEIFHTAHSIVKGL